MQLMQVAVQQIQGLDQTFFSRLQEEPCGRSAVRPVPFVAVVRSFDSPRPSGEVSEAVELADLRYAVSIHIAAPQKPEVNHLGSKKRLWSKVNPR